jgi:hypothetical protein
MKNLLDFGLVLGAAVLGSSISNLIGDNILFTPGQQSMIASIISSAAMFVAMKNLN